MTEKKIVEEYLRKKYNLIIISQLVRKKLYDCYNNNVEASYLLDLFKKMECILNKIREKNIAKGKNLDGEALLLYDLAVILSYYPKYMKTINCLKKQQEELCDFMDKRVLMKNVNKNNSFRNDNENVSDIVNDIFFSDQ